MACQTTQNVFYQKKKLLRSGICNSLCKQFYSIHKRVHMCTLSDCHERSYKKSHFNERIINNCSI